MRERFRDLVLRFEWILEAESKSKAPRARSKQSSTCLLPRDRDLSRVTNSVPERFFAEVFRSRMYIREMYALPGCISILRQLKNLLPLQNSILRRARDKER
jgi:hypothetical protein